MKKFFIGLLSLSLFFSGCSGFEAASSPVQTSVTESEFQQPAGKMKVVTSFYPLYEVAVRVGGEYVDVQNLVPPGAEPHDYELTPKEIASVYEANILIINGLGMEPWLEKVLPELQNSKMKIIDVSKLFTDLISGYEENHEHEGEDHHEDDTVHDETEHHDGTEESVPEQNGNFYVAEMEIPSFDPHVWLDPARYQLEVSAVERAFSDDDPAHRDEYAALAKNFIDELAALNRAFADGLADCATREFVTNHAAFGYLAQRYRLQMVSIAGLSPEAEPSARDLADLTDLLREKNTKYILVETLVSPKIGETLAREVGAQTLVLNPLEGLDASEIREGKNYVSVMRENLKNLQIAMDCR